MTFGLGNRCSIHLSYEGEACIPFIRRSLRSFSNTPHLATRLTPSCVIRTTKEPNEMTPATASHRVSQQPYFTMDK